MDRRISVEEAVDRLLAATPGPDGVESLPLSEALGRVAARDVAAAIDSPPFDRSPLDGYAVDHRDLAETPVRLKVTHTVYAGERGGTIRRGEAARIMTGAEMPEGATCVVRQEDARAGDGRVEVFVSLHEHANYLFRGEDVRGGDLLARRGVRLDCGRIGLLAGQGFVETDVFRRPRVGLLSTGSELLSGGAPLTPGKIYDVNGALLAACVAGRGAALSMHVVSPDDCDSLAAAMELLLADCDVLVATGGVSVGDRDCMPEVGERLGCRTLFHGVAVKPGTPAMAFVHGETPVVCLSGNPFAAFVTFALLAGPVLRRLAGCARELPIRAQGRLTGEFSRESASRRMIPARIAGDEVILAEEGRAKRSMMSLADCNCLIDVPPGGGPLRHGAAVETILL